MDRVLITGSTGFVGRELADRLSKDKKYQIHTLERYVTGRYSLQNSTNVVRHYANLTDFPTVKSVIKDIKPEYVIHTAAISPVSFSYDHFIEVGEVNYLGTINLAEACYREVPRFKQFIFSGTSEEYGLAITDKNKSLTEDSELHPNSPYAVSKVASDLYLNYMYEAYHFPFTILRPFNTYGRKDNKHFFIESVIYQMLTKKRVELGDPNAIRDWLYIDDHIDGYIKALANPKAIGEDIQLCTGNFYSTRETAEKIKALIGFKGEIAWNATPKRPLDAVVLKGDYSKATRLLNWQPKYNLEEGLKRTIGYWKNVVAIR